MKSTKTAIIIGASRGIGLAICKHLLKLDWQVIATGRENRSQHLYELKKVWQNTLTIYALDINNYEQIKQFKTNIKDKVNIVFICAGISSKNGMQETIGEVDTQEFLEIMQTNTLSPMRVAEQLIEWVREDGMLGIMSSGQGSLQNNTKGGNDVYRASKVALNMIMKSFSARHSDKALLLLAPGWLKTDLGGDDAPTSVDEAIDDIVAVIVNTQGKTGLHYVDRLNQAIAW